MSNFMSFVCCIWNAVLTLKLTTYRDVSESMSRLCWFEVWLRCVLFTLHMIVQSFMYASLLLKSASAVAGIIINMFLCFIWILRTVDLNKWQQAGTATCQHKHFGFSAKLFHLCHIHKIRSYIYVKPTLFRAEYLHNNLCMSRDMLLRMLLILK